jgi:hypothetical protein
LWAATLRFGKVRFGSKADIRTAIGNVRRKRVAQRRQ